ncbi:MAG: HAD-IIIA family hydrolase [Nitrospiraceae bacterium]|nr:MAG: HAD-IIIA family hydrolase [Nitrospiraceae bacterium]
MKREIKDKARKIKLLILDVDGVMTDGSIILDNEGNEFKRFHVRDGHGLKMVQKAGITVGLITGRRSKVVEIRAKELGIKEVHQRVFKKSVVFDRLLEQYGCRDENVAFMGDDVVDRELLRRSGLTAAPADAEEDIMNMVDIVTVRGGGRGAVREFTDLILKLSGRWAEVSGESLG